MSRDINTPVPSFGNEYEDNREKSVSTPSLISLEIKDENELRLPFIEEKTNLVSSGRKKRDGLLYLSSFLIRKILTFHPKRIYSPPYSITIKFLN